MMDLREQLRLHYAKKSGCALPCACSDSPQPQFPDCGGLADKVLAMNPFTSFAIASSSYVPTKET